MKLRANCCKTAIRDLASIAPGRWTRQIKLVRNGGAGRKHWNSFWVYFRVWGPSGTIKVALLPIVPTPTLLCPKSSESSSTAAYFVETTRTRKMLDAGAVRKALKLASNMQISSNLAQRLK